MADEGTMRRIWRYKSDLEQEPDEEKLLEILGKLKRLPVSISALQETGIGKVVNSFRKRAGAAGDLARRVVSSWKAIVEKEVTTSKNRSPSPDGSSDEVRHEQASGDESDADSWNSFQEEEMSTSRSRRKSGSQSTRKRKHFPDSAKEEGRSSQTKHSSIKLDNIKADPDGAYVPAEKKKHVSEDRDVTRGEVQPKSDGAMKVTSHTISLKTEGLQHSLHAHSDGRHQSKGSLRDQLPTSNSHNHSVDGKGDRHRGSITVDRRQRRHNISSSEDEGQQAVDSSHINTDPSSSSHKATTSSSSHKATSSSSSHKPSTSSSSHKPSTSSSSHRPSTSSSSHKPSSSSSSHKPSPSSSSHKPSTSSSSHKPSTSSSSHKPSTSSSSHKPSTSSSSHKPSTSSSSHKPSSSSNSHRPSTSSSSHKPSPSSSSHKPSPSSSSHRPSPSSSSHKPSLSSSSHKPSPSSSSHRPSPSSSSHKPSTSSSSHKPSTSSSSHKPSPPKSSNSASEAMLYNEASTSSGHHTSSPESLSRERTTSSHRPDSDSGQSKAGFSHAGSSRSQTDNNSSPVERGSSRSQTDNNSPPVERSLSSSKKGHRVEHSRSKHSSDKVSCHKDADKVSQKSQPSSGRDKSSSSHSNDNSHPRPDSSDKLPWKSSSSDHKTDSSSCVLSSDQSGFSVSSSTVHIKQERGPHKEDLYTSPSKASSKPTETKNTKVQSGHKRSKPKKSNFEEPELDLFSEALHIKAEPSSPVHRRKIAKQSTAKVSQSHQAAPPTLETPVNCKVKSEFPSAADEYNPSHTVKEEKDSGSSREDKKAKHNPSHTVKEEKDWISGSLREDEKSKHKSHRHAQEEETESPTQDENQMSFEDFMSFDTTVLTNKGKSSVKSASKSSSSSSSKGGKHKQADKPVGSKWASSLTDLPLSSKTSFSVPPPASNVTVTELDILSTLPETHASYKPLRFNPYFLDEDKGPSPPPLVDPDIIGTKLAKRTHVYSGRKHCITEVKSLYDLCMQVLIDNIDAIDYVGIIPYSILKPVLERCTAQQLYQLEDYNPHFLEDTDELWKALCQRDFKGNKPQELENWRELYMRGFEERELKYQRLKQSMSTSITKGQAGRKAQLAYVDTAAKPPREVLRKQKQFGTGCVARPKHGPGSSSGLRAYKPSMLVPASNPMDDRSRMARPLPPMMAKSMQMRKNMRR